MPSETPSRASIPSSCRKVWPSIDAAQLLGEDARRGAVGLRQDHARTRRRRSGPGCRSRAPPSRIRKPDLAQRAAAPQVAVLVVDRLEAVEVDEQQRQRRAVAVDELQLAVERLVEVPEVVERRHLVGDRHLARLLEEAHVLERERHRVGERLQARERRPRRRRRPASSRGRARRSRARAR